MRLLDEIGAREAEYARNTPHIRRVATEAAGHYRAVATIPNDGGRAYAYAVDRERFDFALWQNAARFESVTAHDEFSALDVLWENGRVAGIIGKARGSQPIEIRADVVVGADGRFSLVARKVNAPLYNVYEGRTTSLYYAYWCGVAPYDLPGALMVSHGTLDGLGYLMMDSADGMTAFVVEGFSDVLAAYECGGAQRMYETLLQQAPRVWERLRGAQQVTSVRGLKGVENYYRVPFGNGWALVGDAAHHKDPLGGQGIYDAAFSARAFADAYMQHRAGGVPWNEAMTAYQRALEAETLDMYRNTLAVHSNLEPQGTLQRLLGRYACENPEFLNNLIGVPTRLTPPQAAVTPPLLTRTVAQGVARDVRRVITGEPSPAAVPPLPSQGRSAVKTSNPGCLGWLIALPVILALGWFRRDRNVRRL
jgi:flavin-dependent dehydrogenase